MARNRVIAMTCMISLPSIIYTTSLVQVIVSIMIRPEKSILTTSVFGIVGRLTIPIATYPRYKTVIIDHRCLCCELVVTFSLSFSCENALTQITRWLLLQWCQPTSCANISPRKPMMSQWFFIFKYCSPQSYMTAVQETTVKPWPMLIDSSGS
ncbi:hypothetical protein EV424DRAFT_1437039 [Suillus variegatus]|nr:hypothetical protein EV424DRAFT_1437039 [Suillus variegatus]